MDTTIRLSSASKSKLNQVKVILDAEKIKKDPENFRSTSLNEALLVAAKSWLEEHGEDGGAMK